MSCRRSNLLVKHVLLTARRFAWRRSSSWTNPLIRMKWDQRNERSSVCACSHTSPPRNITWCFSSRTFSRSVCKEKNKTHNPAPDAELPREEDEDFIQDEEVDEIFQQQRPAGIGEEDHRVFIVHPDVKWGQKKQYLTTGESRSSKQSRRENKT